MKPRHRGGFRRGPISAAIGFALASAAAAGPVELSFAPTDATTPPAEAAAREYWAEVMTPSGGTVLLPAYWAGGDKWNVHARATEPGRYRLGPISAGSPSAHQPIPARAQVAEVDVPRAERLPQIGLDPADRRHFRAANGDAFSPVGANLAWPQDGTLAYQERGVEAFARAGLNWMRVWMCHWAGMNLDWMGARGGRSPAPGQLDETVAKKWDRLVETADADGVYLQVVFQHHGQYNTTNDSNWAQNPWNAAVPGGFLASPNDFFTDARARELSRRKYRAIVARWSWSPTIFAWELFNEVHWTDAMKQGHEDQVGRWHDEMADYVRSIDPYHHLITTSTENLQSPIYHRVDFYQPHCYPADLLSALRVFDTAPASLDRPVFYGEMGDDWLNGHLAAIKAGLVLGPATWASIMGTGWYAAQPWDGWQLVERDRFAPFAALARFLAATGLSSRSDLIAFSPATEGAGTTPLVITPGQYWHHGKVARVDLPLDGRMPLDLGRVPAALNGDPAEGVTYHFTLPSAAKATVNVLTGAKNTTQSGAGFAVRIDGAEAAHVSLEQSASPLARAAIELELPSGAHDLQLSQLPDRKYTDVGSIELSVPVSDLAAIGRRGQRFIAAWVWRRNELYAAGSPAPARGALLLTDVPAGKWAVTWWDSEAGGAGPVQMVQHDGGTLRLPTPLIRRHAAVSLERLSP